MNFLLEGKVIYEPESGNLRDISKENDSPNIVRLTGTANRILARLLVSPGEVVERNTLLEEVWEAHGLNGSSSSLNQYISVLRKTLSGMLECSETIISVPKIGFSISSRLDIKIYDNNVQRKNIISRTWLIPMLLAIYTFTVLGLTVDAIVVGRDSHVYGNLEQQMTLGRCDIFSHNRYDQRLSGKITLLLEKLDPGLTARCKNSHSKVFYDVQQSVLYGGFGRAYLSFCNLDQKGEKVVYCNSTYVQNASIK